VDTAQVGALGGQIRTLIDRAKGIYNSIYGSADTSAAEQNGQLTANYNKTVGDVNAQLGDSTAATNAAYAARGTGDSSYRGNTVDTLNKAATGAIEDAGTELKNSQSAIGQWLTEQKGNVAAQNQGLDSILSHISESKDVNELTQLRAALESRITEAQQSANGIQSTAKSVAAANAVTPSATRVNALKSTLGNIVASAAAPTIKRQLGQSFITNSGLSEADQKALMDQLDASLNPAPVAA
jgi:hypothetical protein